MTKVVAKGLNSALQHHPLSPTLYLLLSYHHLHPGAPLPRSSIPSTSRLDLPSARDQDDSTAAASAFALEGTQPARTTLLLGLRVLPRSHTLWREYVKLELGWVEALRRRWRLLGIDLKKGADAETDENFDGDAAALAGGDGAFGEEGEEARRAILSGQLVVHALEQALKEVPAKGHEEDQGELLDGVAFRTNMLTMLRSYPSPLRKKALGVVYADLEKIAAAGGVEGSNARLALTIRSLYDREYEAGEPKIDGPVVAGVELVEALGAIGKEIRSVAKKAGPEFVNAAGLWLADHIAQCGDNADLERYLFSTLKALTKASLSPSAALLARHLELVSRLDADAYLTTARSHVAQHPTSPILQLARLRAEVAETDIATVRKACADAAANATASSLSPEDQRAVIALWTTWAAWEETQGAENPHWKKLLRDSLRLGAGIPDLHSSMLASYYGARVRSGMTPAKALEVVIAGYQPTAAFFALAFPLLAELNGAHAPLAKLYGAWRAACRTSEERVSAVLTWAEWLLERSKGREAYDAVETVRREARGDEAEIGRLEAGWKGLLDEVERRAAGDEDMEEDESSGSDEESDEEEESGDESGEEEASGSDDDEESEDDDMSGGFEIAM